VTPAEGEHVSKTADVGLLQRLEAAAKRGPQLYHAARVLLGNRPELSPNGEPVTRWWSGVEPVDGWEDFLSPERVFDCREHERLGRWHQSCYYGAVGRMNEYTLLAAEACGVLPARFVIPSGVYHRSILHINRDAWTYFLYRLATGNPAAFGLDIYGLPPYADFAFPGLEAVVACTSEDPEREEQMLNRFREGFRRGTGRTPEFVYTALRVDVFEASLLGLRYLIEHKEELCGTPDAFHTYVGICAAPTSPCVPEGFAFPHDEVAEARVERAAGRNDARDHWIYDLCLTGEPYAAIMDRLNRRAGETGWDELASIQGVQQAAVRYAKRANLPLPRRKDRG
jgi:hypothetical protein